jgi:hypothetical protein
MSVSKILISKSAIFAADNEEVWLVVDGTEVRIVVQFGKFIVRQS